MCPASLRVPGGSHGVTAGTGGDEHVPLTLSPCAQHPDPAAGPMCAGAIRCSHFGAIYNPNCCLQLVSCCQSRCGRGAEVVSPGGGGGGAGLRVTQGPAGLRGWGKRGAVVMLGAPQGQILAGDGVSGDVLHPMCCTSFCSVWCRVAAVTHGGHSQACPLTCCSPGSARVTVLGHGASLARASSVSSLVCPRGIQPDHSLQPLPSVGSPARRGSAAHPGPRGTSGCLGAAAR